MSDVRITFDSPREFRQRGKSYWIEDSDGSEIQLPVSATKLETSHGCVVSATIPDYIAEDRGLIETPIDNCDPTTEHEHLLRSALHRLSRASAAKPPTLSHIRIIAGDCLERIRRLESTVNELSSLGFAEDVAFDAFACMLGPDGWELHKNDVTNAIAEAIRGVVARRGRPQG